MSVSVLRWMIDCAQAFPKTGHGGSAVSRMSSVEKNYPVTPAARMTARQRAVFKETGFSSHCTTIATKAICIGTEPLELVTSFPALCQQRFLQRNLWRPAARQISIPSSPLLQKLMRKVGVSHSTVSTLILLSFES